MKVLMVEPGKVPYAAEIGEGLEPLQAAVGGDIQAVYPYDDPVALICNEEGKYMGLPLNRALHDDEGNIYDIVAGNFFLCGLTLWWIVATPDLSISFLRRPGSIIQRNMGRKSRSAKA